MRSGRSPRKPVQRAVLVLAAALFAVAASAGAEEIAANAPVVVGVARPADVLVDLERAAPAAVISLNESTLAAQVAAPVAAVHADVGQQVPAGAPLVSLDAGDFELALRQAEAALASLVAQKAQADARLRRARELGENQYLSADELLARETEVRVVEAQIEAQQVAVAIARRNLDKCRVNAPFDAVVRERYAQVGAYVTPGSPLIQVSEAGRLELDAEIPDEIAGSLAQAASVRFRSRDESWPVVLLRLSPVIGTERRSRRARFGFSGAPPAVGRSGELVWTVEDGLLPANLLVQRDGRLGVFLHRDGRAEFLPLPRAQEGRPVPVELAPDTEIVVQGRERLQPGDAIAPRR